MARLAAAALPPASRAAPDIPGGAGGGPPGVSGMVVGVGETELTVRTSDGQTVVVPLDQTTAYRRESGATATDIEVGASVNLTVGTSVAVQVTVVEP